MRIISGQYGSRRLKAVPPAGTRPTSDKLRETLFNILGDSVRGCCFLDGCAGVGAIGIEAISRGAASVVFAESERKAAKMIRENLGDLGISEAFRILEMDLKRALGVCLRDGIVFDLAFVDPPYDADRTYQNALQRFGEGKLLAAGGLAIFEHSKHRQLPELEGTIRRVRILSQGDSTLSFYRMASMETA